MSARNVHSRFEELFGRSDLLCAEAQQICDPWRTAPREEGKQQ